METRLSQTAEIRKEGIGEALTPFPLYEGLLNDAVPSSKLSQTSDYDLLLDGSLQSRSASFAKLNYIAPCDPCEKILPSNTGIKRLDYCRFASSPNFGVIAGLTVVYSGAR